MPYQNIEQRFITGSWKLTSLALLVLIMGLIMGIERFLTFNKAQGNSDQLILKIETALNAEGASAASAIAKKASGIVSKIFSQSLQQEHKGVETVKKSLIEHGVTALNQLERGMMWISIFIALVPMLAFMGTLVGIIETLDILKTQDHLSIHTFMRGIRLSLFTMGTGVIAGVILQSIYNYLNNTLSNIVCDIEYASNALVDLLHRQNTQAIS